MTNKLKCCNCWLCERNHYGGSECAYWGFPLYHDQRACRQYEEALGGEPITESKYHAYPLEHPMKAISFPPELLTEHDYSNKRHTLKIRTVCVRGIWYADLHYQRHYDAMFGCCFCASIYDGDYATEKEAIAARMQSVLEDETHNRCDEACDFIKEAMMDNRQLELF